MLELHVLGTSSARPCHGRSVSGNVVNTPAGTILVDAGEGIQQRITAQSKALKAAGFQSRTRASKIRVVLLTHGHLDHAGGTAALSERLGVAIEGAHEDDLFLINGLDEQSTKPGFESARSFVPTHWLKDGDTVSFGKENMTAHHCPRTHPWSCGIFRR